MGGNWPYDTWNYYLNITIFPWLEVGYLCTLDAFSVGDYPWNKDGRHNYFNNQDRSFHFRLRLMEGRMVERLDTTSCNRY